MSILDNGNLLTGEKWTGQRMAALVLCLLVSARSQDELTKRAYLDQSIGIYVSERICWWDEVCKREFQNQFRCRCPRWSYCRSPGRYYDAYCSITSTGYIWMQGASTASNMP